jgi:hypothetical protein
VEAELKRRREAFFRIGGIEPRASGSGNPRVAFTGSLNL